MSVRAHRSRRGFVIGELLVGILLLMVAVSSLAALMYSVSRREDGAAKVECVAGSKSVDSKCVAAKAATSASKLVKSATNTVCAGKSAVLTSECKEPATESESTTTVKSRTDSASLALIAKREKAAKRSVRTDRGFIR